MKIAELKTLIEKLKSPRAFVRAKAVDELMTLGGGYTINQMAELVKSETDFIKIQFCRFLGTVDINESVDLLTYFLAECSEGVAKEAAEALDKIDKDVKIDALIDLLRNDRSLFAKTFAIKSLGSKKVERAVPYLVDFLSSDDKQLKLLTIEALRQIGDPMSIRAMTKHLDDGDDKSAQMLLLALGELDVSEDSTNIYKFLDHRNAVLRRAAVWAVAKINYKKCAPKLIEMLSTEEDPVVKEEIVKRIGALAGPMSVKPLIQTKISDKENNVRVYAKWALRNLPLKDKEDSLLKLLQDQDEFIRVEALKELAMTEESRFFSLIKNALLDDDSVYVRTCVADMLAYYDEAEAKEVLRSALRDSEDVRDRAASSLLKCVDINDADFAVEMTRGTAGEGDFIKITGLRILSKLFSGEKTPEHILKQLYGLYFVRNDDVKVELTRCLGEIGDYSAVPVLNEEKGKESSEEILSEIDKAIENIKIREQLD